MSDKKVMVDITARQKFIYKFWYDIICPYKKWVFVCEIKMTEEMEKKPERLSVRLDEEDREAIEGLVRDGDYENVSAFVRLAVKEKINPKLRRARLKREIQELLKDPEVCRDLGLYLK